MRILHVLSSPRAEGTPRLALDWLGVNEHEQYVLFLERGSNELTTEFTNKSKQVFFNDTLNDGIKKTGQIISLVKCTCSIVKPDLVLSWNTGFSSWILLGARFAGVKKLIAHAGNPAKLVSKKQKFLASIIFGIDALIGVKVICCSNYVRRSYSNYYFLPSHIFSSVYNCINVDKFNSKVVHPQIGGKIKVVMVATLEAHKDHKTLLDAWRIIESLRNDLELLIVGDGTLKERLIEYKDELRLKHIVFTGTVSDVPEILKKSNLFVFSTTLQEGFGTVLIEAMAAGLPIIASDVPACREVLNNGDYGILVEAYNADKLANKIIEFVNNDISFDISKSLDYANSFSVESMINQYLDSVHL